MLVISGGRKGVGATTVAVNLAAALAHEAQRVVLIDADLVQADAARQCGVGGPFSLLDVLAGRRSIHEALVNGPAGLQLVPGAAAADPLPALGERHIRRLLRQLASLTPHADWLVLDAGHQPHELTAQLWGAAHTLLLITAPDAVSVMDTYALIKTLLSRNSLRAPPQLVVNRLQESDSAADVHRRIDQSCRRFLGLPIDFAGAIPLEAGEGIASTAAQAALRQPPGALTEAIDRCLHSLLASPSEPALQRRAA